MAKGIMFMYMYVYSCVLLRYFSKNLMCSAPPFGEKTIEEQVEVGDLGSYCLALA